MEMRKNIMSWMVIAVALSVAIVVVIAAISWRDVYRSIHGVAYNKYYTYEFACGRSKNTCVTIANEQGASFNSKVEKYVFLGKYKAIPSIDEYVAKFEDGVSLCISFADPLGGVNIQYSRPPIVHNVTNKVNLSSMTSDDSDCSFKSP